MNCLFNEQAVAYRIGDDIMVNVLHSSAGIAQARNQLVTEFMDSEFDRLVFVDSDITWDMGALIKLAHHKAEYVAGIYRLKRQNESYPVSWKRSDKGEELWVNENGLIEVEGVATGFLALSRSVFTKFLAAYPEKDLTTQNGKKCHAFFTMPFVDGHLFGEDLNFSREWILMGGKIFIDPEIALTHWDFNPTPYPGHIGQYLRHEFLKNNSEHPAFKEIKSDWESKDKRVYGNISLEDTLKQLTKVAENFKLKEQKNELPKSSLP
jgi:hypothetical protein